MLGWLRGDDWRVKVIMGLDLQPPAPALPDGTGSMASAMRLTQGEDGAGGRSAAEEGANGDGEGGVDEDTVASGSVFPVAGHGECDRSLVSAAQPVAAHADREALSTLESPQLPLYLSPHASPLPGMLGSQELDARDTEALVTAAARSGVAVEMVGPKGIRAPTPTFLLANLHQRLLREHQLQLQS